jgi:MFS family permease
MTANPRSITTPDDIAAENARAFLWFRVLFNSRFYYPIFAVLFADFGVSPEQFAILNALWAASIVIFEVPSGALADQWGRRRLVVLSAWLMVIEMLLLCIAPIGGGAVTFAFFAANRVISGLAEACCSGADESLIYDAIPSEGRHDAWTQILARLMRWQSITFMLVALVGAATYSPDFMRQIPGLSDVSRETCLRIPLWLNFIMALATVWASRRFIDTRTPAPSANVGAIIRGSFQQMHTAGRWILQSPAATALILTGLLYDSALRLFYTVSSNYYRLLGIPESNNGLILAGSSIMGIGTAVIVEKLVGRLQPSQNLGLVAAFILIGLTGIAAQITAWHGWAGVLFVVPFWLAMRSLHYFLSQYLHRVSPSENRATILSFKGLAMNLAYGAVMLLFAAQTSWLRQQPEAATPTLSQHEHDTRLLSMAMPAWPTIFLVAALALALFIRLRYRRSLTGLLASESNAPT